MKSTVLAILIILSPIMAKDNTSTENPFLHDDNFPGGYFMMDDSLPHFMGTYMKHGGMQKIKPNEKQEEIIEKQFEKMVKIIMKTAIETRELESIVTAKVVHEGKNSKDLSETLDKISKNRKDLTILQIECINIFKETLTKEQYGLMQKLILEHSKTR